MKWKLMESSFASCMCNLLVNAFFKTETGEMTGSAMIKLINDSRQ
jgi:hypothetical protein